jgi:hypothetical protein
VDCGKRTFLEERSCVNSRGAGKLRSFLSIVREMMGVFWQPLKARSCMQERTAFGYSSFDETTCIQFRSSGANWHPKTTRQASRFAGNERGLMNLPCPERNR